MARDRESGAAATELVIIVPAVMLLVMLVVQFALYYHSANVATAAAQDAVRAARVESGSAGAGQARAAQLLGRSASGTLDHVQVRVSRDGRRMHAEITADVASVIPGVHLQVTRSADGRVEEFLPPSQR